MEAASLRFAIVIIAASLIGYTVTGDEVYTYTGLVLRICNGNTYSFFSNHYDAPGVITGLIAKEIPDNPKFDVYDNVVNSNNYVLYGHGSCSGGLDRDQCATCMESARDQLFEECSWHGVGAQIELQRCKLRYEEYYLGPPK